MSLRSFFTRDRSRERTLFAALGTFLVAYSIYQLAREHRGVAVFLGGTGIALVLAAWLCSERVLVAIGTAGILLNVIAAAVALMALSS
jgi:hypothetical protein